MLWLARALLWLVISAGLLLAGFALFAALLLVPSLITHGLPPQLQREALGTVYSGLCTQALLPEVALTLVLWLVVTGFFPRLDRTWGGLLLATPALAALGFPAVGHYVFTMWTPTSARDYVLTWLLLVLGASAALLIARATSPVLQPGCFTNTSKRGIVAKR